MDKEFKEVLVVAGYIFFCVFATILLAPPIIWLGEKWVSYWLGSN